MNVTTFFEDRVFLRAFDPDGRLLGMEASEGFVGSAEDSTPAVPRELLEL